MDLGVCKKFFYDAYASMPMIFFLPRFVTGSAAVELVSPLLAVDQSSINRIKFCIVAGNHCIQS